MWTNRMATGVTSIGAALVAKGDLKWLKES